MYKNCLTVRHKKYTPFSVWKTPKCMSMRHERMFALIQCWKQCTPPPWLPQIHPLIAPLVLSAWNNISSPPLTMHMPKLTTLKHVKTFNPPPQLIFYIPKLFLKENSLFKTIIKNVWQWGIEKFTVIQCLKKLKCVSMRHEKKACQCEKINYPQACKKNATPSGWYFIYQNSILFIAFIKNVWQWGMKQMQCLKNTNVCQWGMKFCLPLFSVWKQCTPKTNPPLPIFL